MCLCVAESKHAKHTFKSFKNILSYARFIPQLFFHHYNLKLLKPLFWKVG